MPCAVQAYVSECRKCTVRYFASLREAFTFFLFLVGKSCRPARLRILRHGYVSTSSILMVLHLAGSDCSWVEGRSAQICILRICMPDFVSPKAGLDTQASQDPALIYIEGRRRLGVSEPRNEASHQGFRRFWTICFETPAPGLGLHGDASMCRPALVSVPNMVSYRCQKEANSVTLYAINLRISF